MSFGGGEGSGVEWVEENRLNLCIRLDKIIFMWYTYKKHWVRCF